jgi:hypothetical protein
MEQVTSCTALPDNRSARCAATAEAVACSNDSPVKSQPDASTNLAAALRRSKVVSISTGARSPKRPRAEAMSEIRLASVSAKLSRSASASRPSAPLRYATSSRVKRSPAPFRTV